MRHKFNFETLQHWDSGVVQRLFDKGMAEILDDLERRPTDKAERELVLKFKVSPQANDRLELVGVQCKVESAVKRPKLHTAKRELMLDGKDLIFNDAAPENPRQRTLDEAAVEQSGKESND